MVHSHLAIYLSSPCCPGVRHLLLEILWRQNKVERTISLLPHLSSCSGSAYFSTDFVSFELKTMQWNGSNVNHSGE